MIIIKISLREPVPFSSSKITPNQMADTNANFYWHKKVFDIFLAVLRIQIGSGIFCLGKQLQRSVFGEDTNYYTGSTDFMTYEEALFYFPTDFQYNVHCFRDGDAQGSCLGDEPQHGVFRKDLSRSARMPPSKCHT